MSPPEHPPQDPAPDSTDSPETQDATVVQLHRKRPPAPPPSTGDGGTFQGTPMPPSTSPGPAPVPEESSPEWRLAALAQAVLQGRERSLTDPAVAAGYDAGLTLALRIVDGARVHGGLTQSTYTDLVGTLEAARRAATVINPDHQP